MKVLTTAGQIGQAFKNVGRVSEIVTVFVSHGFADLLQRMQLSRFLPSKYSENPRYKSLPTEARLRLSFEELGPTFVKLGQGLSTRPDLIPESFVEEFEKLQDKVASVPFPEIKSMVESDLRAPLSDVFKEFDETPMAAASIAQVHGAMLKDGARVAVKVQRHRINRILKSDISILRGLAHLLERYVPETRAFNPVGLVEEFFRTIQFELDFRVEANNIRRIKRNLASFSKIVVPEVYNTFSTNRVLVLERFDGIRFSEREAIVRQGVNPAEIVEAGCDAFFHMVMRDGLFHGDLHAGNLFVLPDGRIAIIDFGIVGRLSRRVQDSIIIMFTALVEEDFDTLASEYIGLCQTTGEPDFQHLQKDLMDSISPYIGMPLGEVNTGKILLKSTSIATRHRLQVPRELMLLFRAILTIEALGKRLDPAFDILQVGTRLAKEVITARYSKERILRDLVVIGRDVQGLVETTPRLLRRFLRRWSQNNFAVETRNRDVEQLSVSIRQHAYFFLVGIFSMVLGALAICLIFMGKGPYFFGLPVTGLLVLSLAITPLLFGLWFLRRHFK